MASFPGGPVDLPVPVVGYRLPAVDGGLLVDRTGTVIARW
jgi:hypothetical protein